jgi:hypothetical protein
VEGREGERERDERNRKEKKHNQTTGTFRFISRTPIPEIGFPSPILTQEKRERKQAERE